MALEESSHEESKTRRESLVLRLTSFVSSVLVAFASWYVYSSGNSTLYISNWSARLYVTLREFDFQGNLTAIGSVWSPMEGFGQRSLENPLWLNLGLTHMLFTGGRFQESFYGLSIGVGIFTSTYFMTRRFALTQGNSVLCGVLSTFVLLFPSSFQWQRQTVQSGSLILLPIAVSLGLGLIRDEGLASRKRILNLTALGVTTSYFTFSFGLGSSLFLIPLFLFLVIDIARSVLGGRNSVIWQVGKGLVASSAVGLQVVPQLAFIQLSRQSQQVTQASQNLADLPSSYWGDLAQPYAWYRWLVLGGMAAVLSVGLVGRTSRKYASLGYMCLGFTIIVAISNAISIHSYKTEIFPSSTYFIVALIPTILVSAIGTLANLRFRWWAVVTRFFRLQSLKLRAFVVCLPAIVLLMWSLAWVQKNEWMQEVKINSIESYREDAIRRVGSPFIPVDRLNARGGVLPVLDELSCTLLTLAVRGGTSKFCGRVLLVDSETQTDASIPRRDPTWVARLYEDLSVHGVPVVNSYGSRYSGPFWRFTSLAFSDGSDVIRAWTVYNKFNLRVAQMFGVKVVISDRLLPELRLIREFSMFDRSGERTRLFQYRVFGTQLGGAAVTRIAKAKSFSDVIDRIGTGPSNPSVAYQIDSLADIQGETSLRTPSSFGFRVGFNSVHVSGTSIGKSLILLPFEYSSCLEIEERGEGSPQIIRMNGIQLAVLFDKTLDAIIRLNDPGLGLQSCWSDDILPPETLK